MPKFTIIIPTYNAEELIHIPIDSLKEQTFEDFEVLIINDGSTDNTANVVWNYIQGDSRFRMISKPNSNWGGVINYVLKNKYIQGDWVTILDSDDSLDPKCLEMVSKHNNEIIATNINAIVKGKKKKVKIMPGRGGEKNLSRIFTPYSNPQGKFYRRDLFERIPNLTEGVPYQDGLLYNSIVSKTRSFYWINKPLVNWGRLDDINMTTGQWNIDKVQNWLEMCERAIANSYHYETTSWVLMKLKELADNYHGQVPTRISVNKKRAKFLWVPIWKRKFVKLHYLNKTRRFRK